MPDVRRARTRLVADLVRQGRVRSARVRDALESVPRHAFLPDLDPADAYADEAVPIKVEDGVTLSSVSQPSMVAIMLEQLDARPGDRVLEIGAGAGWNAALLAHVVGAGGAVTTMDIDDDLVRRTRANLDAAGITGVDAVAADGAGGHPPGAPYDRIELTVGSTDVRPEWVEQLRPGGRLVLPLTVRGSQLSVAFVRSGPDRLDSVSVRSCAFVRLRGAGADPSGEIALSAPGWSAQVTEPGGPTAALLDGALAAAVSAEPPSVVGSPDPGSVADVWDGLGLWCALADPAVFRLRAGGAAADSAVGRSLLATGAGRVAVGIAADDGVALLAGDRSGAIHGFGDDGAAAAGRLAALVEGWVAAGRPHAADLRIEARFPALAAGPAASAPAHPAAPPPAHPAAEPSDLAPSDLAPSDLAHQIVDLGGTAPSPSTADPDPIGTGRGRGDPVPPTADPARLDVTIRTSHARLGIRMP